jgi:hypothetical protein
MSGQSSQSAGDNYERTIKSGTTIHRQGVGRHEPPGKINIPGKARLDVVQLRLDLWERACAVIELGRPTDQPPCE